MPDSEYRVASELDINESVVIGLHDEVVEMMDTSVAANITRETVKSYCTCSVRSTC